MDTYVYVYCSITLNSQDMGATQVPINRQLDKEVVVYIYIKWNITQLKKNEILPLATMWMDLENKSDRKTNTI